MKLILPDHPALYYMGRIDFTNPKAPLFTFPGSQIRTCFTGTSLKAVIKNYPSYYETCVGYLIDGKGPYKINIAKLTEESVIELATNLKDTLHEVIFYKTHDGAHYFDFRGFILDDGKEVIPSNFNPTRRIEAFGDSVSAGSVIEATEYEGQLDPVHDGEYCNSWYSHIMTLARNLNASVHNTSQGGVALLNGTGYFCQPHTVGMEFVYDKVRFNPALGTCTQWDFKSYIPHVVILAIGQNDNYPEEYMKVDKARCTVWKEKYKEWVRTLRTHYPNALFILTTTLLIHDKSWDDAITEIQQELDDEKVVRYIYKRNGSATPGHLRINEAKEMADELTSFIESFGEVIWESN